VFATVFYMNFILNMIWRCPLVNWGVLPLRGQYVPWNPWIALHDRKMGFDPSRFLHNHNETVSLCVVPGDVGVVLVHFGLSASGFGHNHSGALASW
jgi:hypothetical protein